MAENNGKPNNELFELNDLLRGVEASDESVDDILAEVYGRPKKVPEPSVEELLAQMEGERAARAEAEPEPIPESGFEPESEPEPEPVPEPAVQTVSAHRVKADDYDADESDDSDEEEEETPPVRGKREKVIAFPVQQQAEEAEEPVAAASVKPWEEESDGPSAWVEPKPEDLPPVLIEAAFDDGGERPDGYVPGRREQADNAPGVEREEYRAADAELEEEPQGNRLRRWKARIDAFADAMFTQAAEPDEDQEKAERYIPGTDEEVPLEKAPKRKRRRRTRRKPQKPEDVAPGVLARGFYSELPFMSQRILLLFLLSFVNCYLAIAGDTSLPLPPVLREHPAILAGMELWLLGWAVVYSLDVLQSGLESIRRHTVTLNTVGAAGVLFTVLDALTYLAFRRPGPAPFCAPATLVLFGLLWGMYDRRQADYMACRQAGFSAEAYRITKDEVLWNARDTFTKEAGDAAEFGSQICTQNGSELLQSRVAPIILIVALLSAIAASFGVGHPTRFLWALSVILIAASPLSSLLCYAQPWLKLTVRLDKAGAAAAGWPGIDAAGGEAGVLLNDTDLFPQGTVELNGLKVYGGIPLEKLIGCAASVLRASGSGLDSLFGALVRSQGGYYRGVDDLCYYEGGVSGTIRGEKVLVGSADFMALMDVPLPKDLKVNQAAFCAIDGALRGIFALNYRKTANARTSVHMLLRDKLIPVMAPRDFNVVPGMVRQKLRVPVERLEYPPVDRRLELTEPGQGHSEELVALLKRDTVEAYAETIVGCRRMRSAVRASSILTVVSAVIGLLLGAYLTVSAAYYALSPTNLMAFLLIWLVPTLLLSGNVNRY